MLLKFFFERIASMIEITDIKITPALRIFLFFHLLSLIQYSVLIYYYLIVYNMI